MGNNWLEGTLPENVDGEARLSFYESKSVFSMCRGSSLLAQQYHRINRKRASRWNPRGQ